MAFFGDINILPSELVSCEMADEFNIITGYRSSQFLGRKARAATLRIIYNGVTATQKVKQWTDAANLGTSRGFGFGLTGTNLEGIFSISKINKVYSKEINGVIYRMAIDVELVEDASQKVR